MHAWGHPGRAKNYACCKKWYTSIQLYPVSKWSLLVQCCWAEPSKLHLNDRALKFGTKNFRPPTKSNLNLAPNLSPLHRNLHRWPLRRTICSTKEQEWRLQMSRGNTAVVCDVWSCLKSLLPDKSLATPQYVRPLCLKKRISMFNSRVWQDISMKTMGSIW